MDFVFLIPLAFFATVALIVKWSLDYSRSKNQYKAGVGASDNSLGLSELRAMISEAVEEANEPLLERVEALEARLDALPEPHRAPLLEETLEAFAEDARPTTRSQRVA